ncbi:MAG: hypothetical protein ABIU54_09570 [Candidatus Eisenbacteria bacterium]
MRVPLVVSACASPIACLLLAVSLLAAPRFAFAQAFTWLSPVGGETWTAGTTHTLEWSGGPSGSNIGVYLISLSPYQVVSTVQTNMPYGFTTPMTIPANLVPGAYQVYISDTPTTTWTYSSTFTLQAPPTCGSGCTLVAVVPDYASGYPITSCGTTAAIAYSNAQSWLNSKLTNACPAGYTMDPSSVVSEFTQLPLGSCYVGQFGAFQVEATAVACCCAAPTSGRRTTWGGVKSHYR